MTTQNPTDLVHWVKAGDLTAAKKYGLTVVAQCGLVWVPKKRRLLGLDPCPECEEISGPLTPARGLRPQVRGSDRPHYVYRCYDADGVLLYVGCTVDLAARRQAHAAQSWWFPQVDTYRATIYPSRNRALDVEAAAIASEHPLWNVRHQSFADWPSEQISSVRLRAERLDAPDAVLRRFDRLHLLRTG